MSRRSQRTIKRWFSQLVHSDWSLDRLPGVMLLRGLLLRLSQISMRGGVGTSLSNWKQAGLPVWWRVRLLGLCSTALLSVVLLAAVVSRPLWHSGPPEPYRFPDPPHLNGWQLIDASTDASGLPRSPRAQAIARHVYAQEQFSLNVETRYFADANGDVAGYTQARLAVLPGVRYTGQPGVGNYIVFEHADQLWLSACIDSRGLVTVKPTQFSHNRRVQDRTLPRLLAWLFGLGPLEDRRAIWTLLAMPLAAEEREETLEQMEGFFREWVRWNWVH
jgi:cyanosortase A-associated protein